MNCNVTVTTGFIEHCPISKDVAFICLNGLLIGLIILGLLARAYKTSYNSQKVKE